jgi:hypothetical protein
MVIDPVVYQERYRWTARAGWIFGGLAFFFVLALVVPMPLVARAIEAVLFGGLCLLVGVPCVTRRVALRVDQQGITLGGSPFTSRTSTRVHAWGDIERVVLWDRITASQARRGRPRRLFPPIRSIGLQRRPGAPPLNLGIPGPADRPALSAPVPGIPIGALRMATGWSLDKQRLIAAVAEFAPAVEVLDLSQGTITQSLAAAPQACLRTRHTHRAHTSRATARKTPSSDHCSGQYRLMG